MQLTYADIESLGFTPMPSIYKEGESLGWRKGRWEIYPYLVTGKNEKPDFVWLIAHKFDEVNSPMSCFLYPDTIDDFKELIRMLKIK